MTDEYAALPDYREAILTTPVCSGNLCHVKALPMAERIVDGAMLFLNRSPTGSWVGFRLRGVGLNRDAIGAVVRVKAGGRTQIRQVDAAGGYLAWRVGSARHLCALRRQPGQAPPA